MFLHINEPFQLKPLHINMLKNIVLKNAHLVHQYIAVGEICKANLRLKEVRTKWKK